MTDAEIEKIARHFGWVPFKNGRGWRHPDGEAVRGHVQALTRRLWDCALDVLLLDLGAELTGKKIPGGKIYAITQKDISLRVTGRTIHDVALAAILESIEGDE